MIFTFWEPRGRLPAYLRLCIETWRGHLPQHEVVVLNHSNLESYIAPDVYDPAALRSLPYPMQKDAILVAVLAQHGGIFMDVDTIVVDDLAPIHDGLREAEVVRFATHMAVVGAREGSSFMARWLELNRDKLRTLGERELPDSSREWDFAGNSTFERTLEELSADAPLGRLLCTESVERTRRASHVLGRCHSVARNVRQRHVYRTSHRGLVRMLDRKRFSFMPELLHYPSRWMSPREKYRSFWFRKDLDLGAVLFEGQSVIGLHNSWTPEWYLELREDELREDGCLLSRTLRHLTGTR